MSGPARGRRGPFSRKKHREALIRRRIKAVVEHGAMARLFRKGTHGDLQEELFRRVQPLDLARIRTRAEDDRWLARTVELDGWRRHSRNGLATDRWAYFAKLVNIVVYEIVANRELFGQADWRRLRWFLHVPIDSKVTDYIEQLNPEFRGRRRLKGMSEAEYLRTQEEISRLAACRGVPAIWFEDTYSRR